MVYKNKILKNLLETIDGLNHFKVFGKAHELEIYKTAPTGNLELFINLASFDMRPYVCQN